MAWTEMQKKAIETKGTNIIVSAGAGSGKTAVLSERILKYCLDGNDIRKLLVLTFTSSAAAEMKERVRKKLIDNHLTEQASLIDSVFITTFDAYSLALVKKYYYIIGVSKDLTILDQSLLAVKKQEFLDHMFLSLYENHNEKFFILLNKYAKQDDKNIKKIILDIFNKLELIVDVDAFCNNYESNYYNENFISSLVYKYEKLVLNEVNRFGTKLEELKDLAATDLASEALYNNVVSILANINKKSYDELYPIINEVDLGRVNPKASSDVKELKVICSEILKDLKEHYFNKYSNLFSATEEIKSIKDDVLYILTLALELRSRLYDYKKSIMAFDYTDVAKMAINLVTKNQDIHDEISLGFNEILIDEYQDTSDIQEAFIAAISRNNCYMVGDIKQSIYGFRNANPYIFKEKYDSYSIEDNGIKIDLTFNFRSRMEVIENINLIFSTLMTDNCGDADYFISHMMHFGQEDYNKFKQNVNFDMDILKYEAQEDYSNDEIEAFICAKKIKEIIDSKALVIKGDNSRPVMYSDIAILIDKTKTFPLFKQIFEYFGIPLSIEADLDLNDSILPKIISNIILLINQKSKGCINKAYLHALASVGRSFLFEYSDAEIYQMVVLNQTNELTNLIDSLALKVNAISIEDLFFLVIKEFQFYKKIILIGDVDNSCVAIDYLASLFTTMKNASMEIDEVSDYFTKIFDSGVSLKYKLTADSANSVHLMTIHKSKGLEFPYCIFPMLGSKFNMSDSNNTVGLSKKYGIYIPYRDEANSNTIIQALAANEIKTKDISEKVRLFYVALTRAREKIILISEDKDYNDFTTENKEFSSFNQMLYSLKFLSNYFQKVDIDSLGLSKQFKQAKERSTIINGEKRVYEVFDFKGELLESKPISKELKDVVSEKLDKSLELGLKFHECLEVLDFNNPNIDQLPVDDFVKGYLKEVLNTPLFLNIKNAKTYHEHEFYFDGFHGIIDMFAVYVDHIDIIDYKLSNVESAEYKRQLGIYKDYLASKSNKPIKCYLLSILKKEIKEII